VRGDLRVFHVLGLKVLSGILGRPNVEDATTLTALEIDRVCGALVEQRQSGSDEDGLGIDMASAVLLAQPSRPIAEDLWHPLAARAERGYIISAVGGMRLVAESTGAWRERARSILRTLPLDGIPSTYMHCLVETEWMYEDRAWRARLVSYAAQESEVAVRAVHHLPPEDLGTLLRSLSDATEADLLLVTLHTLAKTRRQDIDPASLTGLLSHPDGAIRAQAVMLTANAIRSTPMARAARAVG
jgi:hypothetical protein